MASRIILLAIVAVFAQPPEPPVRGTWAATNGRQTFQGTWTAQPVPGNPNAAQGSWELFGPRNQVVAGGTWSAAKEARGWSGSWQARIVKGRGVPDQIVSGSWSATVSGRGTATLIELFRESVQQQVSGTWARGAMKGAWSIRGVQTER